MTTGIFQQSFSYAGRASDLLDLFMDRRSVFLLESSLMDAQRGRYSFLGYDPFDIFQRKDLQGWDQLKKKFQQHVRQMGGSKALFPSGMVGYLGYDAGIHPQIHFGFYDCILEVDHLQKRLTVYSSGLPEKTAAGRRRRAQQRLQDVQTRLAQLPRAILPVNVGTCSCQSNFTKKNYIAAVNKALHHIACGDIYQVNLAQRFTCRFSRQGPNAVDIYKTLQELSPSCFGGYWDAGKFQIISSSPERFLQLRGRNVETRPMKGTRPRGRTFVEDQKLQNDLQRSSKDIAELLMITDLERNDLGQVCDYGSVKVQELRTVEQYQTVYQATSTVTGRLRKDQDGFDLLRACFPGGSITGCPKIRAQEIIRDLESVPRGVYTGCLGYMSFTENMDFNILIRTLLRQEKRVEFHVGAGIVADSIPQKEYEETLVKARAIQTCLKIVNVSRAKKNRGEIFFDGQWRPATKALLKSLTPGVMKERGIFETLRAYDGKIFLWEEHLRRLRQGAARMGMAAESADQAGPLLVEALRRNRLQNARLRVMLWKKDGQEGDPHVAVVAQPYRPPSFEKGFRAVIYPQRAGILSGLKELVYQPFAKAARYARRQQVDEALIFDRHGHLLEGSRSNVFIVTSQGLLTPSLKSGCLPGITRERAMLLARELGMDVDECDLTFADVLKAREIFVTNSLIEVMPVVRLEGKRVGRGCAGPVARRLQSRYQSLTL